MSSPIIRSAGTEEQCIRIGLEIWVLLSGLTPSQLMLTMVDTCRNCSCRVQRMLAICCEGPLRSVMILA